MTRAQYNKFAEALGRANMDEIERERLISVFCEIAVRDNSRFDSWKFRDAVEQVWNRVRGDKLP